MASSSIPPVPERPPPATATPTVRLAGDAWLTDGQNEIRGNTLVYDIGRQRVAANPGETEPGGVRITINPKEKPEAAKPRKPPSEQAPRESGP